MSQDQSLEALHDAGGECNREKSLRFVLVECLGTDMIEVVLRHVVIVIVFDVGLGINWD